MARRRGGGTGLTLDSTQALVGYQLLDQSEGMTRYAVEESELPTTQQREVLEAALSVIGAWRDLDWQEMIEEADRRRHEVDPTPPIEL